ncbi:MAG: S41 family peptidase [Firmicutes bacterium]|nr:S41 family peptidase [Bacillota bacterium]
MSSLDSYSTLYTADEYAQFENSINNAFYGIGVTLEQDGEYVKIAEIASTQAQEAGIEVGDKIVKVDDVDVVGWSMSDVRSKVIGELGTTVKITVLRGEEELDLVAVRTEVRASTVNYQAIDDNIGYIKISSFGSATASEFNDALDQLNQKGIKKIILDLRDNGGGVVVQAVAVAQSIVPEGKIIDLQYRNDAYNVSYTSSLTSVDKEYVVLVNENTASASEILASAIQDSGVGILLGTQTYGKAVVQTSVPLENGSIIYLTIGQYITRNGNEINGIGLTPDVEVTNTKTQIDATQYTKFDFRTRWALGDSSSAVIAAKERLSLLGYYIGSTDNETFNTDLQTAVKEFQLDNGITPYGVLDVVTQVILEDRFEDLEIYEDTQLEEAYELLGGSTEELSE